MPSTKAQAVAQPCMLLSFIPCLQVLPRAMSLMTDVFGNYVSVCSTHIKFACTHPLHMTCSWLA